MELRSVGARGGNRIWCGILGSETFIAELSGRGLKRGRSSVAIRVAEAIAKLWKYVPEKSITYTRKIIQGIPVQQAQ